MEYEQILKTLRRPKAKSHFAETEKFVLGLPLSQEANQILKEYYKKTGKYAFPIGTKNKPSFKMSEKELRNPENYVFFPLDKSEVTSLLFVSIAGTFKTRLMKRFAYYYQKAKYYIFIFDAKSDDWVSAKKKGGDWWLYKGDIAPETPDKLKMKNYVAPFVTSENVTQSVLDAFIRAGNTIKKFDNPKDWTTMGFAGAAPTVIRQLIMRENLGDADKLLKAVIDPKRFKKKYQMQTLQAIGRRLDPMIYDGFFNELDKDIPILRDWKQGYAISYHFYTQDEKYTQTLVGKFMQTMRHVTEKERTAVGEMGYPKMIFCDDAGYYAKSSDMVENLASHYLINALHLWRSYGFNMVFTVQSPKLLSDYILDGIKHVFVGRIGDVHDLDRFGITDEIRRNVLDLEYTPEKKIIEYLWFHPDRKTYERFFPLNCPVGHELLT